MLVVDETGDLKTGVHSVGVQRQYTGTAGRIENAQVAVHLTYAARRGHAFIDRALYLPPSWVEDTDRRTAAGVPAGTEFATNRYDDDSSRHRAGVPTAWVAGDEVYSADPTLRQMVPELGLGYVLQVAANRRVPTHAGRFRVDALAATAPETGWQHYSCGPGSKGPRFYAWTWIALLPEDDEHGDGVGQHPADPPQRRHPRAGLPSLLQPESGAAIDAGASSRAAVAHRGIVPNGQGPGRARSAPSPPVDVPAPLGPRWRCLRTPSWPSPPRSSGNTRHGPTG